MPARWHCQADVNKGLMLGAVQRVGGVGLLELFQVQARRRVPQHHHPVRLRVGERAEQHPLDDAEDGAVGSYAEGQGAQGDGAEDRGLQELADGKTQLVGRGHEGLRDGVRSFTGPLYGMTFQDVSW
jgi:hypothetical protein